MTPTGGVPAVQFAGYTFDEASGDLSGPEGEEPRTQRLAPQPALLLGHLIRKHPEIASLDEIRELLWPDVQVEFEKSLHTCVRKIRVALGDSASKPQFVETVPRRGYRFLVEASAVAASASVGDGVGDWDLKGPASSDPMPIDPAPSVRLSMDRMQSGAPTTPQHVQPAPMGAAPAKMRPPTAAIGAAAAALVALILWLLPGLFPSTPSTAAPKVAVMPFEPIGAQSPLSPGNGFAEAIVQKLVASGAARLDVIGPTTTRAYPEHTGALGKWIKSDGVDYVINGREVVPGGEPRVLVEIIRGRDGAHVWAQYMDQLPAGDQRTDVIAEALAKEIAHPRQRRP